MDQYRWETVSTYSEHPIVMAAVCANIEYMIEESLVHLVNYMVMTNCLFTR